MGVLQYTLSIVNNVALRTCIIIFGYFIPAISSVRAVIHKDYHGYNQWLSYFLILNFFNYIEPFLDLALNPWLKVPMILWLSLPRYQGASVIYHYIVIPCLDRYEDDMDDRIATVRKEGKRRFWCFMSDTGYSMVQRALAMARLAREGRLFEDIVAEEQAKKEAEEEKERRRSMSDGGSDGPRRHPQHSFASSSFSSFGEDDNYLEDFLEMMTGGLFVFSSVTMPSEEETTETMNNKGGEVRLRVLSYEKDKSAFAISHVDSSQHVVDDCFPLPLVAIDTIKEDGGQGIVITLVDGTEAKVVLSSTDDRETLLGGLNKCLVAFGGSENTSQILKV